MILEAINHKYPDTIQRLALKREDMKDGQPYGEVFVKLFPGKQLPPLAQLPAILAEYQAAQTKAAQDMAAEKKRQEALAAKWPDPFALLDDILDKGIAPVKAERDAIKEANPKPVKGAK